MFSYPAVCIVFLYCLAWSCIVLHCQEGYSHDKVALFVEERDVNDETSDTITTWACATREVLYRVVEGIALESGLE